MTNHIRSQQYGFCLIRLELQETFITLEVNNFVNAQVVIENNIEMPAYS